MKHLQTIQQVFAERLFRVPDYQRSYAWERRHCQDLLDDLESLSVNHEHYTGTLVLCPASDCAPVLDREGGRHHVYDIVDGQQRLTTIVILLDAIRRALPVEDPLAQGIRRRYIFAEDRHQQECAKLALNQDTRDFFEQAVLAQVPDIHGATLRSHQLLAAASQLMRDYVTEQRKQQGEGWLLELHDKVTNCLKLTMYEVTQEGDVGVIFEVMNNRGKPLSEMEKVKNYLLYLASKMEGSPGKNLSRLVNTTWSTVFRGLLDAGASSTDFEDQLLRSHWLMACDPAPNNWEGYNSVKERFSLKTYASKLSELALAVTEYVSTLGKFAVAYCDLVSPNRSAALREFRGGADESIELMRAAERMRRLGTYASFAPVLGALRLKHPAQPGLYRRFLELAEKFVFRVYRLHRSRANAGQSSLYRIANQLYLGQQSPEQALAGIEDLLHVYSPDTQFHSLFTEPSDWYGHYGLVYMLVEYETHLAEGEGMRASWEDLSRDKSQSVEHILPQAASHEYWISRWSAEQMQLLRHDLGNLCLTLNNSSYGRKPFPEKKGAPKLPRCYASATFFMERGLTKYEDWTPIEFQRRRAEIVAWVLKRWEVPKRALAREVIADDDLD